ncbi:MAG: hypothetical protein SFY67_01205 [Candidatus Melainabacteria bacterium]|nr:hypothetical protein [Candidatus Melainabacteria bacterium]
MFASTWEIESLVGNIAAGFGKSEGSPTIRGMADDARAAYECLVQKLKIDPKRIVHFGISLGSGPAALIASEKTCGG